MALTLYEIALRVRRSGADQAGIRFALFDVLYNGMLDAISSAWPHFFNEVVDESSYVGSSNVLPPNTSEVLWPATFLGSGSDYSSIPDGEMWAVWYRNWNGSAASPVPVPWTRLRKGIWMDRGTYPVPKIKFVTPFSTYFELRLYGGIPVAPFPVIEFSGAAATDIITANSGSYLANSTVVFGADAGQTLPAPLSSNTRYYIVSPSGATFKVALTQGGTPVDLTSDGTGMFIITSNTLAAADVPGFLDYLRYQAKANLHMSRATGAAADRQGHGQKALLAQQMADDMRKRHAMTRRWETLFNRYGK